tara:strand:+ start:567 stop:2243 length:1677 start_codon:yes stop_codon:yes gene_type:complete
MKHSSSNLSQADKLALDKKNSDLQSGWDTWEPLPRRQSVIIMAGVMLAIFLASLDQTIVATAIPKIVASLGGFDRFSWVTTSYLVASTAIIPIVGKLSDIYGRRAFFLFGIAVFIIGSILAGLSADMSQLIAFRAIQGVGGGTLMSCAFIAVGDLFPPAERGKYMGLLAGIFALSSIIGPITGGALTDSFTWRWAFFINIPLGIPIGLIFLFLFPKHKGHSQSKEIDYMGIILLLVAIVPAMLGLSWGGSEHGWISIRVLVSLGLAGAGTILFIINELQAPNPIMPLTLYRNPIMAVGLAITLLLGVNMFTGPVFMPLFFQGSLGKSATDSGLLSTAMMLGTVFGATIFGQLISRFGGRYRSLGLIGIIIMAVGLFLLTQIDKDVSLSFVIASMVVMSFGMGTTFPCFNIAIQNAVHHKDIGIATSSAQFIRSIGASAGLALLGSLLTTRFASRLNLNLPDSALKEIPSSVLEDITTNPSALMDSSQIGALESQIEPVLNDKSTLIETVISIMRQSLAESIAEMFIAVLIITAIAFVITFWLKEIPLQKRAQKDLKIK